VVKQHGRWVYHRAFKSARKYSEGLEWWHSEEAAHMLLRRHMAMNAWNPRIAYASLAERVIRCTNRYARRFGGVRTVADWQKLALHIADRAGFTHQATIRAITFDNFRSRSLICIGKTQDHECRFPWPKWSARDVYERAKKINAARQERLRQERIAQERAKLEEQKRFLSSCAVCGKQSTHRQWANSGFHWPLEGERLLEISGLLPLAQLYDWRLEGIPFCFSHGMQFKRILKRTERLQKQRIQINRTKKELRNEATQNHA
jgi:hypothetical protein